MSSENFNTVIVSILDKDYQVNCPEEQQSVLIDSARHLDAQMRNIHKSGKVIGLERIAVMAALNITHDLIQEKANKSDDSADTDQIRRLNNKADKALKRLLQIEM